MAEGVDQSGETPPLRSRIPRMGRPGRIVLALASLLLLGLIALWLARKPIASRVIDAELAKRGVVARYGISDLGFGRQRLTQVVIGDPAAPDLVADWLETDTHIGVHGPVLDGVRAGHVRLRGRIAAGRLSLGELDKLMPAPSGKPFALPQLLVDVDDARMRLDTPTGVVGLKIAGRGRLDDGFSGRVAVVSNRLEQGGCTMGGARTALRLQTASTGLALSGPVRVATMTCAGVTATTLGADLDVRLTPALDGWRGTTRLATGAIGNGDARIASVRGTLDFTGNARRTTGTADLTAAGVAGKAASAASVRIASPWVVAGGTIGLPDGQVKATGVRIPERQLAPIVAAARGMQGTPVGPLARALATATGKAARAFDLEARVAATVAGGAGEVRLPAGSLRAASGARATLDGSTTRYRWGSTAGGLTLGGALAQDGGGMPTLAVRLAQARTGAPVTGVAILRQPYAAGGARLALAPVRFSAVGDGTTRIATRIDLSGPLADGRIDGLTLPIELRWDRSGLAVNPVCVPFAIQRLAVAGLALDPLGTTLCPIAGPMLTVASGRMAGGVRLPATRIAGRLGQTPLTLAASGAQVRIGDRGFTLDGVAARLGSPERVTRIDLAQVSGRIVDGTIGGRFEGGAGQIANVPLLLGEAAGDWSLRGGALTLAAGMTVRDAAPDPRFNPLAARDVTLRLADGAIAARGTLYEPTKSVKVADVTIAHALATGQGTTDLAVPGIAFTEGFQPDLLTRLTYGVVAEVRGSVQGEGHIAWNADGVTSTGRFATQDAALAAAFGPVSGITTTIRFTDLLALESAPGQVVTIGTVNPGIAVNNGTITYQLLPGSRVQVDSGLWPFAGGTMTLLPTTLDFAEAGARRMTFRLQGVAADQFLQQFDFKNLDATGIFDGELPMVFDVDGGRIENGRLAVREGGGGIAYVGELTQKDLGIWGNIAFQALKSLRYRNLTIGMNGPLAGEMVTDVRFAGVTQGQGAKANFLVRRLQRLPFVFNIRIKAPFRGLLDSAQSFYDPRRLIRRNLPALLERQRQGEAAPVQPPASGNVP